MPVNIPGCAPSRLRRALQEAEKTGTTLLAGKPPDYYLDQQNHFIGGDSYGDSTTVSVRPLPLVAAKLLGRLAGGSAQAVRQQAGQSGWEDAGGEFDVYAPLASTWQAMKGDFVFVAVDGDQQRGLVVATSRPTIFFARLTDDWLASSESTTGYTPQLLDDDDDPLPIYQREIDSGVFQIDTGKKLADGTGIAVIFDTEMLSWTLLAAYACEEAAT